MQLGEVELYDELGNRATVWQPTLSASVPVRAPTPQSTTSNNMWRDYNFATNGGSSVLTLDSSTHRALRHIR